MMNSREYQSSIVPLIQDLLPGLEIVFEWTAFRGPRNHYSPRVDISVGPFSIEGEGNQRENYRFLLDENEQVRGFIRSLYELHCKNFSDEVNITPFDQLLRLNRNSRCLFAIEIENRNSKKHFMGSLINAASLGRVGIGVAFTDKAFNTFSRLLKYLEFLRSVEKNTYDTRNFLVVKREQFSNLLGFQEP